jgi:hypothetical protein
MTKFQNKSIWVIRNWNLNIVWDLVLGNWCFRSVADMPVWFPGKPGVKGYRALRSTHIFHPTCFGVYVWFLNQNGSSLPLSGGILSPPG